MHVRARTRASGYTYPFIDVSTLRLLITPIQASGVKFRKPLIGGGEFEYHGCLLIYHGQDQNKLA